MAKFRIWAKSVDYCYVDIEAENEETAYEYAAENVDGGSFHNDWGCGSWDMLPDEVMKLDDNADVDFVAEEEE